MKPHSMNVLALARSLTALAVVVLCAPAYAQIVADPSAPGNQRPTILQTANGIPLVNIQTPSAAGVSRNTYSRFDIDAGGAILNNSRTSVPTQLGGPTPGNPWINTPARVILNEVNSSNPSYLNGPVEVAGQRAEVIVANPSGIRVNGGTFLNASGVTLTTGTPVMNSGNLESFRVVQGTVVVEGLGLDTRTADHTTILARAMEVNAGLWAKHLTVVTGANDVKALATGEAAQATPIAGTGPAPKFMLDVAAIGGMYAGHIFLVGTEAGLGVNNRGTLAAQEGEWVLQADGWLVNTGKVQAKGDLSIQSGAISNTGAGAVISSQGNATLAAGASVSNTGGATIAATGALGVHAGGSLDNTDGDMLSAGTLAVTTNGPLSNVRGQLQAVGAATIDTRGAKLDNTAGRVSSQSSLALTTGELVNGAHLAQAGLIGSEGNLTLQAGAVTNGAAGASQSNIWSAQTASVTASSFTNSGVLSGTHVTLEATTGVSNAVGASIEADGNLTISTPTATLSNAGQLIANETLAVNAKDIHNTGRMEAADQTLEATNTFTNAAGASVTASNAIDIGATTFNNRGLVNANEATGAAPASQVHIQATTVNNTGTGAIFGDRIAVAAITLNNRPEAAGGTAPVIAAREQLDIGVLTLNNEDGARLYSGGSMAVGGGLDAALAATGQAQAVNNLSASIEAIDNLRIGTQTLTNERRNVSVSQVQIASETATLNMPDWWVNGKNYGWLGNTSNHNSKQYYLLDPASIVSETPLVTLDGNLIYKVEVRLDPSDSVYQLASGSYAGAYGARDRITVGAGTAVLYVEERRTGVSNPDQVAGAPDAFTDNLAAVGEWQHDALSYSNAYGRCATNCTLLVVQTGYSDPSSTILRNTQRNVTGGHDGFEISRTSHHTVVEDQLNPGAGAAAAIRSGTGMQLAVGSALTNSFADILAGGVLDVQATGATVSNTGQTLKRTHRFQITSETVTGDTFGWTNPDIGETLGQLGGALSGAQQLNITAKSLTNTDLARSTGLPTSGLGFLGVALPAANAPITVPHSALFHSADPGSAYLVEGDARFKGTRQWLGSDYLLSAMGHDPAAVQKRLGDSFYEQRLLREQVAQLTGRRFLDGYANDEAQYRALMDSGVVYAQQWQLIPGVALTAEQMARLTTDLVWLVERDVVLPDGTRTKALVPQLYVRQVPEGDFQASGALLAGNRVNLQIEEDLVNAGGRIEGDVVIAQAGRDLNNIGGLMQARSELLAKAGRHVTISSPTHTTSFTGQYVDQSRTELAAIGEMKVGNAAGAKLSIEADGNVTLQGASVSNASTSGTTTIRTDGNVELKTVEVGNSDHTEYNAKNHQRHSQSQEVGSQVLTHGTTVLDAGNDINSRQGTVDAGAGLLSVQAGNNVNITAGQSTQTLDEAVEIKRSGPLTKKTTTTRRTLDETASQGSTLSGGVVAITANNNIAIEGSAINGADGVLVHAGNVLSANEARDSRSESESISVKKSGFAGSFAGVPLPIGAGSRDATTSASNTAVASRITSANGGVLLQGEGAALLQGVKVDAAKDITIQGGVVSIAAASDYQSSSSEHYTRGTNIGMTSWHDPGKGIDAKNSDKNEQQASSLNRTVLDGANVSITATGADGDGGLLAIAGTTVNTPGTLSLSANELVLGTQTTQTDISATSQGGDWAWQEAKGQGSSDQTTNHNQFNVGVLATPVQSVQIGLGARDSISALRQQPGMGWVEQIHNDPTLAGKVDWAKVEEAHQNWHYSQQGLTPEAAAVVTLVVAYFTAGAASGAGATAGNAAAVSAGEGVALAGGGTFVTATGATISSVVGGAVTAGISALAGQAAVALINNKGDIGGALDDLGSNASVKSLLTAIATGGVLGGLNLNPTGLPTTGAGSQGYMTQLGQNLQAAAAKAVIGTAINGGSLEDSLTELLKTAFIDTFAAQGAHQIGDWTQAGALHDVTNKIAHAIAGCAIGAAKAGSSSGCGAGALGATIGELSAELHGTQSDTVQFASMMAGIAAAMAGGDAAAINLASQTGANAAANNYLSHAQWKELANKLKNCKSTAECEQVRRAYAELSAKQDAEMRNACVDISSAACRQHLEVASIGSQAQEELVKAGALPASYLGGNDLNAQARRTAINALAADIRRICNGDPQCAAKNQKALTAMGSALLDVVPVIGDIKGYVEAETPFDYLLVAVGMTGPVGDGITKLLKEGKLLYQAGDIAGSVKKIEEAKSMSVAGNLSGVSPSASGLINKTKLGEAVTVQTDTLAQRLRISDVVANGDWQGVKTEALVHDVLTSDTGFKVLDGTKYVGNNGLDHVVQYVDSDTGKTMTMVIDSKQLAKNGTTGLDPKAAGSVMQLSDTSIRTIAGRLGDNATAHALEQAIDTGTLVKAVAYVDKSTGQLKIVRVHAPTQG